MYYFVGVLNSRVLWKWFQHYAKRRGVGLEINGNVLGLAPVRRVDLGTSKGRELHDEIVATVTELLAGRRQEHGSRTSHERDVLVRQWQALDDRLDRLVYRLYDLTQDEIREVEEATV